MDIRLSGMDSPMLLDHLRDLFPLLPVLALAGYADAQEVQQYSFDGFIEKPVAPEQLIRLIKESLSEHGGDERALKVGAIRMLVF